MKISSARLIAALGVVFLLSGCGSFVLSEQPKHSEVISLNQGDIIGQTFTPRYDGLQTIILYLEPGDSPGGLLELSLRGGPTQSDDIRNASLPVAEIQAAGLYHLTFWPILDSTQRDYYLQLQIAGAGDILVGVDRADQYLHGSLYLNDAPQEKQLSFRLGHDRTQVLAGLTDESIEWLFWLLAGVLIFFVPGWAILDWAWPTWSEQHWATKLALGSGVSLAFYPLFLVWTDVFGLHLGVFYGLVPAALGLCFLFWKYRHKLNPLQGALSRSAKAVRRFRSWDNLVFLILIGFVFGVRFWMARSIAIPMWGDSVEHSVMAQLVVDNRGLFTSWAPYAPYQTLSVHFGFAAATALFSWATGLDIPSAVLVNGQILNALAVLALIPLTLRISAGNLWAGIGAFLVAGMLSPMPAYYINWGRYAQLSGQVALPILLWMVWDLIELATRKGPAKPNLTIDWKPPFLTGLILAGTLLLYYRMVFFFAAFLLAGVICWGIPRWKRDRNPWRAGALQLGLVAIIALAALAPWLWRVFPHTLGANFLRGMTSPATAVSLDYLLVDLSAWLNISTYLPNYLLLICLLAAVWSLARRQWFVSGLVLWYVLLAAYLPGMLIGLPGANLFQTFTILIALYIPAGLLAGWLFGEFTRPVLKSKRKFFYEGIFAAGFLTIALWGALQQRYIPNQAFYGLATRPDLRAIAWIEKNIAPDAVFLVEGARYYQDLSEIGEIHTFEGTSAVGADAGWWLPLLSGRKNSMPPQYALLSETSSPADYSDRVVRLVATLENNSPGSPQGIEALCDFGITHVYFGQKQGLVGHNLPQLFAPEDFLDNPSFELLYREDRAYVFQFQKQRCARIVDRLIE